MSRPVGITNRNQRKDPVRHIFTYTPASRSGANHLAPCGTSIRPWPLMDGIVRVLFDPDHPRACSRCVNWLGSRSPKAPT